MYRPKVTIKKYDSWSDATANYESRETRLNLLKCKQYAEEENIEFHEFVARCLNHEFIHHLLNEEQGRDTSYCLDHIAKRLKDFWLW
jgi:hypothetical protein